MYLFCYSEENSVPQKKITSGLMRNQEKK